MGIGSNLVRVLSLVLVLGLAASREAGASQATIVSNGGFMQTLVDDKPVVLPLHRTEVEAEVAGVVASVEVSQEFVNPYRKAIEASYLFPLPPGAAVTSYAFVLGARTITGVVRERVQAQRLYQRARAQGRTAALLEQERPNAFTQSIANILPGDRIKVKIRYLELLSPSEGHYAFSFPMVVGPRYIGGEPDRARKPRGAGSSPDTTRVPDASRITPPLLAKGLRPGHDIALRLTLQSGGRPVRELRVLTHRAKISAGAGSTIVVLDPSESIPNKDFVVHYSLAGKEPELSLLAHRGSREGHLLLAIHPPPRPSLSQIAPREYVFVVDNSGSMEGFPSEQARAVVKRLLASVRTTDSFQLIAFSGEPAVFAPRAVPATPATVRAAEAWLGRTPPGGGTELIPALSACLRARRDPARSRIVLFLTDGYIGDEPAVLRFLRDNLRGASLFALGVGTSANRFLIDGMARLGGGEPFYLLNQEEAGRVVARLHAVLSRPSLTSITVDWGGLAVEAVSPRVLPDLFAERPLLLAARYTRPGRGTIRIRGLLAGRPFEQAVPVVLPDRPAEQNRAVPLLWARRRIAELEELEIVEPGQAIAARQESLRTALAHNLVSKLTSLVAVDRIVRHRGGQLLEVPVALPLPEGTSESAAPARAFVGKQAAGSQGPDQDRDGIPDSDDRCPAEPEVWNGFEDDDGCPDHGRVVVHRGRIEILDKIYFRSGSARVSPPSRPILDAIAATLRGNPQILQVEIQGHSDARGSHREQVRLALARARAVVAYLIGKGVEAGRLVARGYGASRPLDRRHTSDAWSRNRRVETLILRRSS